MNAEEIRYVLKNAVKGYLAPETIRPSENVITSGLRQSAAIREMLEQLRRFVTAEELQGECLDQAEAFITNGKYRPALHTCLAQYWATRDALDAARQRRQAEVAQGGKMAELITTERFEDTLVEKTHRIRGLVLRSVSQFHLFLEADPRLESPVVYRKAISQLETIVAAMKIGFSDEGELYHCIYNGSLYLYDCCRKLISIGYYKPAALFLGWCAKSCDGTLKLCTTTFLDWRVRLYTTLCLCYEKANQLPGANQVAQWLVNKVEDLNDLEHLDVVPPSEKQQSQLNKALDTAHLLALKYNWCAATAVDNTEVAIDVQDKGKGGKQAKAKQQTDDHASPQGIPTTATEVLEKLRAVIRPGSTQFDAVTQGLLLLLSDSTTRLSTNGVQPAVNANRRALNQVVLESLWFHAAPVVDEYLRRNEIYDKAWERAAPEEEEKGGKGKGADKKAAPPKKDASKTAKDDKKQEETDSSAPAVPALESAFDLETMLVILRCLLAHRGDKSKDDNSSRMFIAFDKCCAALLHRTRLVAPTLFKLAQLLQRTAALLRTDKNRIQEECKLLAETIHEAITDKTTFEELYNDIVEDSCLIAQQHWQSIPQSHEIDGAGEVYEAVALGLALSGHEDSLVIANAALVAARYFEHQGRVRRALVSLSRVEETLLQRQTDFVVGHNVSKVEVDPLAETLEVKGAVTIEDSVWLRALVDARTELHRMLCKLRLQKAIDEEFAKLKDEHLERVSLMKKREAESHLYGSLSKKEVRAIEVVENETLARPFVAENMESKLIAWSTKLGPVALALAYVEIALCQKTPVEKGRKMAQAFDSLQSALTLQEKLLREAKGNTQQFADPVTPDGLSVRFALAVFAHNCTICECPGLLKQAAASLVPFYVLESGMDHAVWNKNLCNWDILNQDRVDRSSTVMLQWLSKAFTAFARLPLENVPEFVPQGSFEDGEEEGLDKRRYAAINVEKAQLRSANFLSHALQLSVASNDDGSTLIAINSLFNAILPLLNGLSRSLILLRPLAGLLHAMRSLEPRRWSDGTLQLAAVRALGASFDLLRSLSDSVQRSLTPMIANAFCDIWQNVLANPNPQQLRHITATTKEIAFCRRIFAAQQEANGQPETIPMPETTAKGAGAKKPPGKGKAADKGAVQGTGANEDRPDVPKSTIFNRAEPTLADRVPSEYLDLLDRVVMTHPLSVAVLEQRNETTEGKLFPPALLSVASVLHSAGGPGVVPKVQEYLADLNFVKLTSLCVAELIRRRQFDWALQLCTLGIKESKNRHAGITLMEIESLRLFREQCAHQLATLEGKVGAKATDPEAQGQSGPVSGGPQGAAALSLKDKAQLKLTKAVGTWRRRTLYRTWRLVQRQYDVPWQAMLELQLSTIQFYNAEKEVEKERVTVPPAERPSSGQGQPKLDPKVLKGPAPPAKAQPKSVSMKMEESKTPRDGQGSEEKVKNHLFEPLASAIRALILFGRIGKAKYIVNTIQHAINICRSIACESPPSSLVDAASGKVTESTATSRPTPSTATPSLTGVPGLSTKAVTELFTKAEGPLKLLCFQILGFLDQVEEGHCNPRTENSSLQPVSIRHGLDSSKDGGILWRTTSLHLWQSKEGQEIYKHKLQSEAEFKEQLAKVFVREQEDVFNQEYLDRIAIEQEHYAGILHMQGKGEEHDEVPSTTRTEARPQKRRRLTTLVEKGIKVGHQMEGIPFATALGDISLKELVRCFMYAVQGLQYGRRKPTAIQLCLNLNEKLRNSFAVEILPFAINLQNSTSVSTEATVRLFHDAYKEQLRTQKMTQGAKHTWKSYRETDTFRQVQARLASTLLPTIGDGTTSNAHGDNISVAGSAVSSNRVGGSQYREVVSAYTTAIGYLRQKHSTEFLVGVLNELGGIHLYHRVKSEAERAWNDCADAAVSKVGSVMHWRSIFSASSNFSIASVGLWKALNAVCALGGLAMFIYKDNQAKALECCLFAAELLWQLNAASLLFPQRHWDQSTPMSVQELLPGLSIEVDADFLPTLGHRLLFVAQHLLHYGFATQAISVAKVLEYFGTFLLRHSGMVVHARCLLAESAASLGDWATAIAVLSQLCKGKQLPNIALAQLGLTYDVIEESGHRAASAAPTGKEKAGKAEPKGAAKGKTVEGSEAAENQTVAEFDNSKPLTDEGNLKAIELFLASNLQPATGLLLDPVAAEYGQMLSKRVLSAVVEVCLSLASTDPLLSWVVTDASQDSNPTGAAAKAPAAKDKGKASASAVDQGTASQNAIGLLLPLAERIIVNVFYRQRPKSAAEVTSPGVKGRPIGTPTQNTREAAAAVSSNLEDSYSKQLGRYFQGRLAKVRGLWSRSTENFLEFLDVQTSLNDTLGLPNLKAVPSFTYMIDSRFVSTVMLDLADVLLQARRLDACRSILKEGIALAEHTTDLFSKSEFLHRSIQLEFKLGNGQQAAKEVSELMTLSKKLEWKGSSVVFGATIASHHLITTSLDWTPKLWDAETMTQYFHDESIVQRLQESLNSIRSRAEFMGLNTAIPDAERFQIHNPSAPMLHQVQNTLGLELLRRGQLPEAERTLREAILTSQQYDSARYPSLTAETKFALAKVLLCKRDAYRDKKSTHSTSDADPKANTSPSAAPTAEQLTLLATEYPPVKGLSEEEHELLTAACIGAATVHDYELIRQIYLHWAILYLRGPGDQPAIAVNDSAAISQNLAAHHLIRLGATVNSLQNLLYVDPTVFGDTPLPNLEDLCPRAVCEELEELIRRDFDSQAVFQQKSLDTQSAATTGAAPAAGKGGDKGSNFLSSGKLSPTLSQLLTYFGSLLNDLRTASLDARRSTEAKLTKVVAYLQTKSFDPTPLVDKPLSIFSQPLVHPKSFSVISQAVLASFYGGRPKRVDDNGEVKYMLPEVTLLISVCPCEAESAPKEDATVPGGKPPAGKGKGAQGQPAPTEAVESKLPVPIVFKVTVDQQRLVTLQKLAASLSTKAKLIKEAQSLERQEPAQPTKDSKKAQGKASKTEEQKPQVAAESLANPLLSGAEWDEKKGELLALFYELFIAAKHDGALPGAAVMEKESRDLFPPFSLQPQHLQFLVEFLDPNGGTCTIQSPELCKWMLQIRNYFSSS